VTTPAQPAESRLHAITAVSGSDLWAVGEMDENGSPGTPVHTLTLHWDGTGWEEVASPDRPGGDLDRLFAVAASSSSDVWTVGSSVREQRTRGIRLHWDGSAWS
jgi:hypothetical protein